MYSIGLLVLLIISLTKIIHTSDLRCYEDINGNSQTVENCRACVIYIDSQINKIAPSKQRFQYNGLSMKDAPQTSEIRKRYRRYDDFNIRQKCARESNGPLYGYDQTHCYCNSNGCNLNIQRCIYEIVSKRFFSCYHGSNTSRYSLEIDKKCRSCRIRVEDDLNFHYECLTFGEHEQSNSTHCTCQHPMCNQDFTVCQRFQQTPTHSRVYSIQQTVLNATKSIWINAAITTTTTTTTTTISSTVTTAITSMNVYSTENIRILSSIDQNEAETSIENVTSMELTSASYNESSEVQTMYLETENHAHSRSLKFSLVFTIFLNFLLSINY